MDTKNAARDRAGVIVTLKHRDTGETIPVTRQGNMRDALRNCLEPFNPAEWRVVTISTPRTIMADLAGRKPRDPSRSDYIEPPEPVMLSRVGAQAYL